MKTLNNPEFLFHFWANPLIPPFCKMKILDLDLNFEIPYCYEVPEFCETIQSNSLVDYGWIAFPSYVKDSLGILRDNKSYRVSELFSWLNALPDYLYTEHAFF